MSTIKYSFIFLLFFFHFIEFEKKNTIIVNYLHSTHIEGLPSRTTVNATLISNNNKSLYEMDYLNNHNLFDEEDNDEGETFLTIKTSSNPYIYKEYENSLLYSHERIISKPILVKDSLTIFKWRITPTKKNILGYSCQEAKLSFRGRDYTAYFTTDLNFKASPWKFSGLPGTVLEIKSEDGVFEIVANKIQVLNEEVDVSSPYENLNKAITWKDFLSKYRKKYDELQSYVDENNVTMSIPKRKIEILIED